MRPRAALLLTAAALLAACGADPAAPTAADTASASPSTSETPAADTPRSGSSTAPAAPSPTAEFTPSTPPPSPEPPPPAEPEPAAPGAADVTIADFDYAPDPVEVAVGGTVTWTNQDSTAHTATVSGGPNTGAIAAGSSGSITFDAPGTYDYVCQFHPGSMAGTVVVGAP